MTTVSFFPQTPVKCHFQWKEFDNQKFTMIISYADLPVTGDMIRQPDGFGGLGPDRFHVIVGRERRPIGYVWRDGDGECTAYYLLERGPLVFNSPTDTQP